MRENAVSRTFHERVQIKVRVFEFVRTFVIVFRFQHSFFVDGSSRESIEVDIINNVQAQSMDHSPITFEDALDFFRNPNHDKWILVYDNVDDTSLKISKYLPDCQGGTVIITTRNQLLGQLVSDKELHLTLGPMSDVEAIDSIFKSAELEKSEENQSSIASIATELGNLPVALVQAGSYILRTMCTPKEYLERLQNHKVELMKSSTGDREDKSAYAAFELSYQRLHRRVRHLLHILSYFHYNEFPLEIISQAAKHKFGFRSFSFCEESEYFERAVQLLLHTFPSDEESIGFTLDSIVTSLRSYSLATFHRNPVGLFLRMHPLHHLWARHCQPPNSELRYKTAAVRLIVSASTSKQLYVYLIPHIRALIQQSGPKTMTMNDLGIFGTILMRAQRVETAQAIWREICQALISRGSIRGILEGYNIRTNGEIISLPLTSPPSYILGLNLEHLATLRALGNYATTYYLKGSYEISEKIQNHVVNHMAHRLGGSNEETLKAKGQLALTYRMQQKYSEARSLQQEILWKLESLFEDEHPDVPEAMANLAVTCRSLGKYSKAQELQEKILEKKKKQFGEDHWETLKAMVNLAKTFHVQGKYSSAIELQVKVRKARRAQLGETHLKTLEAMAHLAITHRSQGNYSAAEEAQVYVLDQRKLQLGESHLSTLEAMEQLAVTYHSQGHYSRTEQMQKQILEERKKRLGENHPDTLRAMMNLAITFRSQENWLPALDLQKVTMEKRGISLGKLHPETLEAMTNLGITYCLVGNHLQALSLHQTVVRVRSKEWGKRHPDTLQAMLNLAEAYSCMGKHEDSLGLQRSVVQERTSQLGENHLDTLEAISCLAITYRSLGNYSMCEELQNQVLNERSKNLGEENLSVQRAMVTLARTHGLQGRYDTAEKLLRRVVDQRIMDLGRTHLDTIASVDTLRDLYEEQGDFIKAFELVNDMITTLEGETKPHSIDIDVHLWERKLMRLANEHRELGHQLPEHIAEKVGFFFFFFGEFCI
jgi:tetratricopeptide (TPR) repeat protein